MLLSYTTHAFFAIVSIVFAGREEKGPFGRKKIANLLTKNKYLIYKGVYSW